MVSAYNTEVEMTQIVLPSHTNNHGTAFGGQIAAWVDICASVSAQRLCRKPVVTASMDALHFIHPVQQNMVVILKSRVNCVWNSSMEIGVKVIAEDPLTGAQMHCCTAYLTFVALDAQGKPLSVPELDLHDDPVLLQHAEDANIRRQLRLQVRNLRLKRERKN